MQSTVNSNGGEACASSREMALVYAQKPYFQASHKSIPEDAAAEAAAAEPP